MWDQALALDLQSKAEGFKRSIRAEANRDQLRLGIDRACLGIDRAYYRRDVTQHKNAVDEMVLSTLKEYANYWRSEP